MIEGVSASGARDQSLTIMDEAGGQVRFHLRLPNRARSQRMPLLIVLAGVKTDDKTLNRAPEQTNNALITYVYNYDKEEWRRSWYLRRARHVLRMTAGMSYQIEAILQWARSQPWVDPDRINIAGGSLGAIYLPMILRDLHAKGLGFRTVTLAYGGAGRALMCYLMLRRRSRALAAIGAALCWLLLSRMEPTKHLPHLKGKFLVISSLDDERIPRRCSKRFEELTPEPKTIIHLKGHHVDTEHPHILEQVFATTIGWLVKEGAIDH